jgi:capsule polysaccharide export protein KpsE/RkpR
MATLDDHIVSQAEALRVRPIVDWTPPWVPKAALVWDKRRTMLRAGVVALLASIVIVFCIPKQYQSMTRIMPPDQPSGPAAMMAMLAGKSLPGGMGALASSLFGMHNTGALFVDLLQSPTVRGHLVEQFELQKVYWKRYRSDAVKKLAKRTEISEDRKSGVITIVVTDNDRQRAHDMALAYLEQLDLLLVKVNTSAARRERQFIEQRLVTVQAELQKAQEDLSRFSSNNAALDIKEQTRAMVDASAKLQAQLIVARGEVESLEQIYTPDNVRVRAARARVGELERELKKLGGPTNLDVHDDSPMAGELYPPLRQLPILGVRWANLYRRVRVEETVYDLLTEEYETARIEEPKTIPTVSVIDPPGWPEKKSFPPRLILVLTFTSLSIVGTFLFLLAQDRWQRVSPQDQRKLLATEVWSTIQRRFKTLSSANPEWRNLHAGKND